MTISRELVNFMTPTIFTTKRGLVVWPYEKGLSKSLENFTSSYDQVYHKRVEETGFIVPNFMGKTAFITHEQSKSFLMNQFPKHIITLVKPNRIETMNEFEMNPDVKLKPVQEEIFSQILNTRGFNDWFINLQTGQGKTMLGIFLSQHFRMKTMITCYLSDILDQWELSYRIRTNMKCDRIIHIDKGSIIDSFMNPRSTRYHVEDYDVFMSTPGLLAGYCKANGYEKLNEFFNKAGIGLLIFDEAHRNIANIVKINAVTNVLHTLYLSADYAQAQYKREEKYYRIFGNRTLIVKPSQEMKLTMQYTDIIVIEYNTHPSEAEKFAINNAYGYSAQNYLKYQMNKGMMIDVIDYTLQLIMSKDTLSDNRVLILLNNIDPCDKIYEVLRKKYKQLPVGRFHSRVPDDEKDITLEYGRIIVATYSSFSTGRDLSKIKYVIGTNQSNKIEDNQSGGRARPMEDGSHVKYIMLVDGGFDYCVRKLNTRLSYLRETKMSTPVRFKYEPQSQ